MKVLFSAIVILIIVVLMFWDVGANPERAATQTPKEPPAPPIGPSPDDDPITCGEEEDHA